MLDLEVARKYGRAYIWRSVTVLGDYEYLMVKRDM